MLNLKNCSISRFISYVNNKRVYAFGAGELLKQACHDSEYNLEKVIFSFTDNDSCKWNKDYIVGGHRIPIIPVAEFVSTIGKDDIILVASYYYAQMVEQLDKIEALNGIECFIFPYMEECDEEADNALSLKARIISSKEKEQQIPKKIHYIWFGGKDIPDELKKYMESWQKFCPDYEIIEWNENNYDVQKNQYLRSACEQKRWSKVSNYARIDIIHENGGIYLDNDIEIIKPIDDLLYNQAFMAFSHKRFIELGSGFGAKKNFKILRSFLDLYGDKPYSDAFHSEWMSKRGDLLCSLGFSLNNTFQCIDGLALYPGEFFSPVSPLTGNIKITENTYSIHHFYGSWEGQLKDNRIKRVEFNNLNKDRITDIM